jgi:hypothetical protein
MFLSMIGCTVVEAAFPALLALLEETMDDVQEKSSKSHIHLIRTLETMH